MGPSRKQLFVVPVVASLSLGACAQYHDARVQTALLPPPSATPVLHSTKLWVELGNATWENQCRSPKAQRPLCFDGVRRAAFGALERSLWTSFPEVALRDGEPLQAGDYVLSLDITLNALPPDAEGPGWSALAAGGFRLSRDGRVLHEERLGSRSRAAFPYGSALGVGAGEVVDAFAVHVAEVLGAVTEDRPLRAAPLPAVVAEVLTPPAAVPDSPPEPTSAPPTPDPNAPASNAPASPALPTEPMTPVAATTPAAASALGVR
jgi:hypothetical protein